MKRLLSLVIALLLALFTTACSMDDLPFLNKDTQVSSEDEELKYKIEKVILSKGYQSIEQKVEVVKKNNDISLFISVGLLESSGVYVDQVVKNGNVINIHVVNELEEEKVQLAVPQILLDIKNAKSINMDDVKFNIVNDNFKPINIKLGLNEAVNKAISDLKVVANSSPEVTLSRIDDKLIWNVTYGSIFDIYNIETPLVNLSVDLDANTGEILESKKGLISSYIDDGEIMNYLNDKFLLYRKKHRDLEKSADIQSIWYYDIAKNEKTQIYQTVGSITSTAFSPDSKHIYIIENNGNINELYIVSRKDKKAFKLLFQDNIVPSKVRWYDNDTIYILANNSGITNIYSYNIRSSKEELEATIDMELSDFRIKNKSFLLLEDDKDNTNKNIYYSTNLKELILVDNGYSPRFISSNLLAYLQHSDNNERNKVSLYDIRNDKKFDEIDVNAQSFSRISDSEMLIIEKNQNINDFTLYEYSTKDKDLNFISKLNSNSIYLNKEKNLLYVDLDVPFEAEKSQIIYSVDISKLKDKLP